jgi:hypothetical protein
MTSGSGVLIVAPHDATPHNFDHKNVGRLNIYNLFIYNSKDTELKSRVKFGESK